MAERPRSLRLPDRECAKVFSRLLHQPVV